jgi:tetratricopeptide (TPR) repeat protein
MPPRLLSALIGALLFAFPSLAADFESSWRRALELHRTGDLQGAVQAYQECLAADPARYDARSNLGAALSGLGRYAEAIEQYRQALTSAPGEVAPRLLQNLALAYYKSGDFSETIHVLEPLRSPSQPDLQLDLLLADSYLQTGDPSKAASLLAAHGTETSNKAVAYLLGTALIRSGQVDRGQHVIDPILREGDSAEAHFLVGTTMFVAANYPAAVKELSAAAERNPSLPSLQSYLGQSLLNTGDADGAAAAFRKELSSNPNDYESNLRLGEILAQRNSLDDALSLLRKAASLRPQSFEAAEEFGEALLKKKDFAGAQKVLESLMRQYPDSAQTHARLAEVYTALGRRNEAAEHLRAARSQIKPADQSAFGPKVGDPAPYFVLPKLHAAEKTSLDAFRSNRPIAVLFGSYTCPYFREQAPAINELAAKYRGRLPFLLVYIREAHADDLWQSTINQRQGIDWKPAATMSAMQEHAGACLRKLKMDFPALVDDPAGTVEAKYGAWPSRLFVIGRNGRVLYSTRLGEQDFRRAELEAALESALR